MKVKLTQGYMSTIKPKNKGYWITDSGFRNLRLYVGSSGSKTWYVCYQIDDKNNSYKLGSADIFTVTQAHHKAGVFLSALARGEQPDKKPEKTIQLGEFIELFYAPWVEANRKRGKETTATLRSIFRDFLNQPIEDLKMLDLEKWRMMRQEKGTKASTLNRQITTLRAALNWGVGHNLIESNPLSRLKPLQEHDSDEKVRYLSIDERRRLFAALDAREARIKEGRENHNKWLAERNQKPLPVIEGFADYLKPLVIIALNTGFRRGSLFGLKWEDVDFNTKTISLPPLINKPTKLQQFRVNKKVVETLTIWKNQSVDVSPDALVFPSPKTKDLFNNIKRSWEGLLKAAKIENFRFHDLRHDFASQLVMKGVDLNTVRDLMGHADLKMTLKYAHLSPDNRQKAVEVLVDLE